MREQMLAEWRQGLATALPGFAFPASLAKVASNFVPMILLSIYLATALVAGEYEWGTVRTVHLTSRRGATLAARVVVIVGLVAIAAALGLLLGSIIPFFLTAEGRPLQEYAAPVADLWGTIVSRLLCVLPFIAIPVLMAVLTGSTGLGFLLTLLVIVGDAAITGAPLWATSPVPWVPTLTLTGSISRMVAGPNRRWRQSRRAGSRSPPWSPGRSSRSPSRSPGSGALTSTNRSHRGVALGPGCQPTLRAVSGTRRRIAASDQRRSRPMTPIESDVRADNPGQAPLPFDPDDDDRLIGRVLSRREVLALMGAASVSVVAAACAPGSVGSAATGAAPSASAAASSGATATALATASAAAVASGLPSCVVVPELTEGPYYVDEKLDRSDIRIDTSDGSTVEGDVLRLDWVVSQVDGSACIPLEGVLVDVWHCDALGNYSDVGSEQGTITCAATSAPTRPARPRSRRSTPAGTRAAPSTSTSRSAPTRRHRAASSSRRSSSSTTP